MADTDYQRGQFIVLKVGDDAVFADPIAPEVAKPAARQWLSQFPWIPRLRHTLFEKRYDA